MNNRYSYADIDSVDLYDIDVFVLCVGDDQRSLATLDKLKVVDNHLSSIILIQYQENGNADLSINSEFPDAHVEEIKLTNNQTDIIRYISTFASLLEGKKILIDITEIRVPEIFIILKLIKERINVREIRISYTIPLDYIFDDVPFLSYHSYHGDLKTEEVMGFGGTSFDMSYTKMIVFMGFEGSLSQKVNEDIQYQKLVLVNNLPSVFAKYKDISVICNYELLKSSQIGLNYVPADNPFEIYNFLKKVIDDGESVCVAPLSTKVVALGVCIFALEHENVRVVYPTAQKYSNRHTNEVFKTLVYDIVQMEVSES